MATARKPRPTTRRKPAAVPRKRTAASPGPIAGLATRRNLSLAGAVLGLGAVVASGLAWLRLGRRSPTETEGSVDA